MDIRKVGVIGAGLMGSGVAQTCAQSGYETIVSEVNQQLLDKGLARISSDWDTLASKGKLSQEQVEENRAHLHGTLELRDFADCDLVIEAVIEQMEEKLRLFPALDHILKPEALILSNTSSLNITQMGAVTRRPDKVCGLHFFNPAPVMKLVEIVKTILSSEETIETVRQFSTSLGKTPVVAKDTAGNKTLYSAKQQASAADTTAPTAGNSGTLTTSSVGITSMNLNWTAASDDSFASSRPGRR